jgi:hypothetical protein
VLELGLPLRGAERRHHAHDRLPLGDRQTGFGQPGRAADQHHGEHECGDGEQPQPDGAPLRVGQNNAR